MTSLTMSLTDLNGDAMFNILSFLTASDIDSGPRLVSKQLCKECSSNKLWKSLCDIHGKRKEIVLNQTHKKIKNFVTPAVAADDDDEQDEVSYYHLYRQIPCVPEDFPTITQALDYCPPGSTITLMPGTYTERLFISKSVKMCAADPEQGASLVWYRKESFRKDQCAIEIEDSCDLCVMQDLRVLHFSRGADIWTGNCAVYCTGSETHLQMQGCSIQSDSGKGICCVGGASLSLKESSVHDCAASGVYVAADNDGHCDISNCNIMRNGFGTRTGPYEGISQIVPPGHSGLFIEVHDATVTNSLIAENCVNGMSVIPKGPVHISKCDLWGNGQAPIVVSNDPIERGEQGTVYEKDNTFHADIPQQQYEQQSNNSLYVRCPHVQHNLLTLFKVHGGVSQFPTRTRTARLFF